MDRVLLQKLCEALVSMSVEETALHERAAAKPEKIRNLLADTYGWGHLYQVPVRELIAVFMVISGWTEALKEVAAQEGPNCAALRLLDEDVGIESLDELGDEEQRLWLMVAFAVFGNVLALGMYNRWLCQLVADADAGDDEALLNAVVVDRVAVQAGPIARRIGEAQVASDEAFMQRLAKAITRTRTRPRRPRQDLDTARYLLETIDEAWGLDSFKHAELCDVFVDELRVYPHGGKDPLAALKKLIQKRNAQARK